MRHWAAMPFAVLLLLVTLLEPPEAQAQRRLEASGLAQAEYGRLLLRWADEQAAAPELIASARGGIVVLRFKEPIDIDLDALRDALPNWIAFARMERDRQGVRLALSGPAKAYVSRSDPLSAVDFVLEKSDFRPPVFVSQQQRQLRRQREVAQSIPPPEPVPSGKLDVRLLSLDKNNRHLIVFRWDRPVTYKVEAKPNGGVVLKFPLRGDPDLRRLKLEKPQALKSFDAFNTTDGFRMHLVPEAGYQVSHYQEGAVIHAALVQEKPVPEPDNKKDLSKIFAIAKAEAEAESEPVSEDMVSLDNQTWLRGNWPNPVQKSGQVKVKVSPLEKGMKLVIGWDKPAPAAIFARDGSIWAVFGAKARFSVDRRRIPSGFQVRQVQNSEASILQITTPEPMQVDADASGGDWHIFIRSVAMRPDQSIKLQRRVSDTGRVSLAANLPTAAGVVWYEDAVIGDQIAAVLAFAPSKGLTLGRRLLEAEILPSAHGIALIPRSDRVVIRLNGETLTVSTDSGLSVTDTGMKALASKDWSSLGFIDFEEWGRESGRAYLERRYALERRLAMSNPRNLTASKAYLELARFYVGHDMGHEALSVLNLVFSERPLVRQDGRFLALRGVAAIQAGRYEMAEEWLSKTVLRGEKSSTLWRALAAARRGEWTKANEMFRTAEELIVSYVPRWAATFHAAAAEAALHVEDWELAARHARQASLPGFKEPSERAALVQAQLAYKTRSPEEAFTLLGEVAEMTTDPVAAQAELLRLELGGKLGQISAGDVAEGLEGLRYRWRGDALESRIIEALTKQYMELGQFRQALNTGQVLSLQNPDAPRARELRQQSMEHFRQLFLNDQAKRLDPIEALALFYEFKSLTPIGADGDRMIRKLAGRLVRFDLLDQASELLQHQIDSRIRGPGRAQIAADLASVYLLDRKPGRALNALRSTRHVGIPKKLARERRLLEATALIRMRRYDHAIELLQGLQGEDAVMAVAEAYWQKSDWPLAAKALSDWLAIASPKADPDAYSMITMRAAIAARMAGDKDRLARLRKEHMQTLKDSPQAGSFDLITAYTDTDGAALAEAVRRMSDLPRLDAFAAALKRNVPDSDTEQKTPDKLDNSL